MSYRTSITNLTKHVNRAHFKNVLPSEVDSSDVETTVVTVEESENDNSHVEEEQVNPIAVIYLIKIIQKLF